MLAITAGCTDGSPLVESFPQVEVTANPGGVTDHLPFQLTLTTWNHLAALHDAATSGELHVTLDGGPLVLDPATSGYAGNHDSYVASYVLPAAQLAHTADTGAIVVTDGTTTWQVEVPDLMANDLQPVGAVRANQHDSLVWPSATTPEPYSTISWACIAIADRPTACQSETEHDTGVAIAKEHVELDVAAAAGDRFTVWGERWDHPQGAADGPTFFVHILDRVDGTLE